MASAQEKSTIGAWLLHHDQKLSAVKSSDFQNIALAGRAARLLSVMSKESQWSVAMDRVQVLARANGIRKHEVPGLLEELGKLGLVDRGHDVVSVLGVTQTAILGHAADISRPSAPKTWSALLSSWPSEPAAPR